MNVAQSELDALRALAAKLRSAGSQASRSVGREQGQRMEELMSLAAQLETRLDRAGALKPEAVAVRHEVPLHLLDTPANRDYTEKIRVAWEAGLVVDRERYGERIGTDGEAQILEMLLADKEMEIGGPVPSYGT